MDGLGSEAGLQRKREAEGREPVPAPLAGAASPAELAREGSLGSKARLERSCFKTFLTFLVQLLLRLVQLPRLSL